MLDKPILITGAARSGTSMTAGVIHMCGAFGGGIGSATSFNQKGMFENMVIRQQLVKQYLRSINCDPLGQNPLPDLSFLHIFNKLEKDGKAWWYDRVTKVIKMQGWKYSTQWYYKGAKMCLLYPLWNSAFPEAKWIIVRRNPEDIINSCMKTGFMRSFTKKEGWAKWVKHHEKLFIEMSEQGLDVSEVWPEKMIEGNFKEIKNIINHLGLEWNDKAINSFITPKLWKGGK